MGPEPQAVQREVAYYYPGPIRSSGDWVKNLILFFDGIALLVPDYHPHRYKPGFSDDAVVAGLQNHDLLYIIQPEMAVDAAATKALATAMETVFLSGALDHLKDEVRAFERLSNARIGYEGDEMLANNILFELKQRHLANDADDQGYISVHPHVRILILTLLSQILRPYGERIGVELSPTTDKSELVRTLGTLLTAHNPMPTGAVVEFDLACVSVNLGPVPIDEILDYRRQNFEAHRLYCTSARKFANELSRMSQASALTHSPLGKQNLTPSPPIFAHGHDAPGENRRPSVSALLAQSFLSQAVIPSAQ